MELAYCASLPFWLADGMSLLERQKPCNSFFGIDCIYFKVSQTESTFRCRQESRPQVARILQAWLGIVSKQEQVGIEDQRTLSKGCMISEGIWSRKYAVFGFLSTVYSAVSRPKVLTDVAIKAGP